MFILSFLFWFIFSVWLLISLITMLALLILYKYTSALSFLLGNKVSHFNNVMRILFVSASWPYQIYKILK